MNRRSHLLSSNGFTLVEIIASITILGIVVAILLPIFPQIIGWTSSADNQLRGSNLLDQAAFDIKNSNILSTLDQSNDCPNMSNPINLSDTFTYMDNYYPVISLCKETGTNLYQTHIEIYDEENKMLSDTYIYLNGDRND
ncbi:type II secretion system protein [Ornithinibacillus sp. 179-J 7C1 HS]|uniref:type II secretion system protein n=1 Tax=Ornithinibacillus sp. 179-J 7C1 HS TaxID=3142384 RepID=UPI0039A3F610